MSIPEWRGRIQNRKDTAANWESKDPVLLDGEIIVVETSAGEIRHKTGDGTKSYSQLPFDDEVVRNLIITNIGAHNTGADSHSDIRTLVSTAQTSADDAQTAAGKAQTAADNAQTTADTAVAAAASAQTTADGKLASVFSAGTSAPSDTRLLWIDTGSNLLKFYDGSAWTAIGAVWSA